MFRELFQRAAILERPVKSAQLETLAIVTGRVAVNEW